MGDCGVAFGEGSGFVDDEEFDSRKFFEGGGVADEDAEAGGAGETAGGGHGGGETEGAGAGSDEDGDGAVDGGADCFSGEDPSNGGGESEEEDEWGEEGGDFIGEALEGRGILFGLVDELGEAGDERLVAGLFGEDDESASGEESATEDGVAWEFFDGERFASEDGFLDGGVAFEDFSVGGNSFAWEDEEVLAGLDIGPGNNFFCCSVEEACGGRGEGEEIFQGVGEFIFGVLFEPLACEDESGDGGGGIEK